MCRTNDWHERGILVLHLISLFIFLCGSVVQASGSTILWRGSLSEIQSVKSQVQFYAPNKNESLPSIKIVAAKELVEEVFFSSKREYYEKGISTSFIGFSKATDEKIELVVAPNGNFKLYWLGKWHNGEMRLKSCAEDLE
jgi:competence protein ComGC